MFDRDIVRAKVAGIEYHFYINDVISEPDDYIDMIDALYQGKPTDTIYIHLNTPGGSFDITLQIINAIQTSEATVIGIADGQVASAGSLILFACPNIGIQPMSYVMMHDGSEGAFGKTNENLKQAQFTSKMLSKVTHLVYGPFFSEEEINSILDGKDMWLMSEEVEERVNNSKDNVKDVNEK